MKLRSDSPFAALSNDEQLLILETAEGCTLEQLVGYVEKLHPTLEFSAWSLKRFVQRGREEALREEVEESGEMMEDLARSGRAGRARDGVLEGMRRKLFAEALESKNLATAMAVFNMMKEEQKEDRKWAIEERRMALEEANAKQEWRRQELDEARSALQLLPRLRALLLEEAGSAEERLAQAREVLLVGGGKLLGAGGAG